MEKGCKNHRETLNSLKGKILYVVRKPCNIYRLQGKPYDNYKISLQYLNITGIPCNIHNLSLWGVCIGLLCFSYSPFPWIYVYILQKKTYWNPVNPCKHLQCRILHPFDLYVTWIYWDFLFNSNFVGMALLTHYKQVRFKDFIVQIF